MNNISAIADRFGRVFPYLRLSITDICNFSCSYCLPGGYKKTGNERFMSRGEIVRLVRGFAGLGTWKVRITGGEPTIRKDFLEIASDINNIEAISNLAFTTNGYKLEERAQSYYDAGLRFVNISIDSLRADRFKLITGHDRLSEVMGGVHACLAAGFKSVKLNTVLLKGLNDRELDHFIDFVRDIPVSLRFIELMRTHDNQDYFKKHHFSADVVIEKLLERGWNKRQRSEAAGPAVEFEHQDYAGKIGLIAPYSKDFCKSCNRLRVSASGQLHLCLFGDGGYNLREYLQSDEQLDDLQAKIIELMKFKVSAHFLHDNNSGVREHLASIGG